MRKKITQKVFISKISRWLFSHNLIRQKPDANFSFHVFEKLRCLVKEILSHLGVNESAVPSFESSSVFSFKSLLTSSLLSSSVTTASVRSSPLPFSLLSSISTTTSALSGSVWWTKLSSINLWNWCGPINLPRHYLCRLLSMYLRLFRCVVGIRIRLVLQHSLEELQNKQLMVVSFQEKLTWVG